MPRDLGDALGPALRSEPVPTNGAAIVRYAGGRRELTRELSGMDGPPRKADYGTEADYKAASTRWRTASRRAQRWDEEGKPGKQRRAPATVDLPPATKGRLRREATARKRAGMIRNGLRARLEATVRVDSPKARGGGTRDRTMPAQGSPGVYLPGPDVADVLEQLADDGADPAGEEFIGLFMAAYGVDVEVLQIENVQRLKVWPEGTREPE